LSPTAATIFGNTQKQLSEEDGVQAALKRLDIDKACLDLQISMLSGRAYEPVRFVLTEAAIALGRANCSDTEFDDVILLHEVDKVEDLSTFSSEARDQGWESCIKADRGVLAVCTAVDGLNAGRKYCFRVDAACEEERGAFTCMVDTLRKLVSTAKAERRRADLTWLRRSRSATRCMFASISFQVVVALLLTINFIVNAFEAEMNGKLVRPDGSPTVRESVKA
jgi:hypothetical protein